MKRQACRLAALLLLILGVLVTPRTPAVRAATPPGFDDQLVAQLRYPTAMAFTPDQRLLVTLKNGLLRVYQNGALLPGTALDISGKVCDGGERGLLGIAVDPAFASNGFVYLYYTFKKHGGCSTNTPASDPVNRVSRFTMSGNTASAASEQVLVDNMPSPNSNHNAGDLHFGKDGYLYIGVGDGGCDYDDSSKCAGQNAAARDAHVLTGKILRITKAGGIPADNPFQGQNSARCSVAGRTDPGKQCQETFASGLRNPFRLAFDPNVSETRFYINDVGQGTREEINLSLRGADYGWNIREGHCANGSSRDCRTTGADGLTDPVHDYDHNDGCASITAGAVVPNGLWPGYDGAYLYSDYVCGKIWRFTPNGSQFVPQSERQEIATNLGGIVTMIFGPYGSTQALYYVLFGESGQVRRLALSGSANRAPTAQASATPSSSLAAPLTVQLSAQGSSDPDGDPLTFSWSLGDGTSGSGITLTHTYTRTGAFTATVTARDPAGATAQATTRINVGDTPPTARIVSPAASVRFAVGQVLTLTATASDQQDRTAPLVSWEVLLHHITADGRHTHPFFSTNTLPLASSAVTITTPLPEDIEAARQGYLEIRLRATDSQSQTTVVTQELRPQTVPLTFTSDPPGRTLSLNAQRLAAPQSIIAWTGQQLTLDAPSQLVDSMNWQRFRAWSDNPQAPASRVVVAPTTATTYTARYEPVPASEVYTTRTPFICITEP